MVDVSHMNYLQAIILGIVQGLTEFLPVSSSAHLLIVGKLIGAGDWGSQFTAIIQLGTELALLIYWRKAIGRIISRWFLALVGKNGSDVAHRFGKGDPDALMGWLVILGTLPIVLAGVLVQKYTDSLFRNLWITVAMLIVFGVILWLVDERFPREIDEEQMTWKDGWRIAFWFDAHCRSFEGLDEVCRCSFQLLLGFASRLWLRFAGVGEDDQAFPHANARPWLGSDHCGYRGRLCGGLPRLLLLLAFDYRAFL